jgi:microcystin-dependent protein
MISKKIILALGLLLPFNSFATDKLISAPTGNLILDAGSSSAVKVNKTLQVDSIKNLAGTDVLVGLVPTGAILPYAGSTAPTGWVFAYGQEVSQTGTYANLYAVLQSTYCTADHGGACGIGNFRLPDMRGRGAFGKDNMGGTAASRITSAKTIDGTVLGNAGGTQSDTPVGTNSLTIADHSAINLPAHYHSTSAGNTLSVDIDHDHPSATNAATGLTNDGINDHTHVFYRSIGNVFDGGYAHPAYTGAIIGPIGIGSGGVDPGTDMEHRHNVDIPALGTASKAVAGNIGPLAGCNGNTTGGCTVTPSTHSITLNSFTGTEGNNLPPTVIVNYIIKL